MNSIYLHEEFFSDLTGPKRIVLLEETFYCEAFVVKTTVVFTYWGEHLLKSDNQQLICLLLLQRKEGFQSVHFLSESPGIYDNH